MDTIFTGLVAGGVAAVVTLLVQFLTQRHETNLLNRELEHQTRAALRGTYYKLLVTQRRSRDASLHLAEQGGERNAPEATESATLAHSAFIEHYHRLNLDADERMWVEVRGLRDLLDDLLKAAREGDAAEAKRLFKLARKARQNLERSFRTRLGYEVFRARKPLGDYDKVKEDDDD